MSETQIPVTVKMWLAHPLPADVKHAIDRLARADDARHIAVMPDVHLASEVCVGTVLATSRLIYPSAVGGDIGCGMAALRFNAGSDALQSASAAARVLENLPMVVPAMRHRQRPAASEIVAKLTRLPLSHPKLESIYRRDGIMQLGTLGRGNHFLEFQSDEEDRLWLMVHSGSRAMGPAIRDLHLQNATKCANGLYHLDSREANGQAYLADAEWARNYAIENRRAMLDATATLMKRLFGVLPIEGSYFDCDHNHVVRQTHAGGELWIHRKGAASAREGEIGIIPGSMGAESFHVEGRGCESSLCSSSHGAGRAMSRAETHKKLSAGIVSRELQQIWYDPRMSRALIEEAPSAYKDIRIVMRAQRELTRIRTRLKPLLSYKAG